jgi:importin subunit alpha-2
MMGEVVRIMGEGAYQVAKEACWILTNICTGGEKKHVLHVVENGGVKALCDKLREMDPKVTESLLDALEAILTKCGTENTERLTVMIDECGGIDALEELQQHENQRVYDKAITMVEKWFGAEEDEEDAENSFAPNIEATSGGGAAFGFGCGAPATPTCAPASAAGGFSFGAVAAAPPAAPSIAAAPAFAGFSFS